MRIEDDKYDYDDPVDTVTRPQPASEVPVRRGLYVEPPTGKPVRKRDTTLAGRTGSRRLPPRQQD